MIPLVHLHECPEPPAYVPDDVSLVVYFPSLFSPPFRPLPTPWAAEDIAAHVTRRGNVLRSASYRMF